MQEGVLNTCIFLIYKKKKYLNETKIYNMQGNLLKNMLFYWEEHLLKNLASITKNTELPK